MLRKLVIGFALATLGLIGAGGVAAADPAYPANVVVNDDSVAAGETVTFSGENFNPGETVRVDVLGVNATVIDSFTTQADVNGRFSVPVTLGAAGVYTLRATGLESGVVTSLTVTVAGVSDSNGGNDNSNNSGGSWNNDSNNNGGSWSDTANEGDLAYTGTSLTTPLAIGAGALTAGLLLLFFGTRMTIRRKSHSA